MTNRLASLVTRIALSVAIMASAALLVDYRGSAPTFCGGGSGCAQVKASSFSHIAGLPVPLLGVVVLSVLMAMTLAASKPFHRRMVALALSAAGLGALGFVGIMLFSLKTICVWCMVVDSSILIAMAASWVAATVPDGSEPLATRLLWAAVAAVSLALPLAWGRAPSYVDVPQAVTARMQPGKVDIVTFTDFECPFCRKMHPVIDEVAGLHPDRIAVQRVMVPLKIHPGAEPAALGYLCTPADKRDAMADALYHAEHGQLNEEAVVAEGGKLGMDEDALRRCMAAPETTAKLDAERQLFKQAQLRGLPSTYVEQELIVGAAVDDFLAAVDRSLTGSKQLDVRWMFAIFAAILLVALGVSLWLWRPDTAANGPEG